MRRSARNTARNVPLQAKCRREAAHRNQERKLVNLRVESSKMEQRLIGGRKRLLGEARPRASNESRPAKEETHDEKEAGLQRGGAHAPSCTKMLANSMTGVRRGEVTAAAKGGNLSLEDGKRVGREVSRPS